MNIITIILIFIAIIVVLGAVIYALIRDRKSLKKEITHLTSELYKANQNATHLAEYIKKVQDIKSKEKITNQKIKEAKNDEEVLSIIADIVNDNNNRVRK
jgi:predicted Holliday junction resolvase-like endonuclease